jgi:hypothetical protein
VPSSSLAHLSDRVRPLRRVEYDRLVGMGLLANEKVELIRGLIVRMSPQHPARAYIVIEVADTSLTQDRREKGALYAGSGVPEYWIVDTAHERVEVHSEIVGGAYGRVTPHRRGESITSAAVNGLQVAVDDIFI